MRRFHHKLTAFMALLMAANSVLPPVAGAKDLIQTLFKLRKPQAHCDVTVERLAKEIDWLEKHIDNYGSIVAKQPDIWGQARLTRHRQEIESQLFCKLNQFHLFINGTISRSDQTFVMDAFALSSAASSAASASGSNRRSGPSVTVNNANPSTPTPPANGASAAAPAGNGGNGGNGGSNAPPSPPTPPGIHQFANSSGSFPFSDFAGNFAAQSVALEPTVALDQLNNYLNHLNELRRINEGDDTADSPGYSLNLVRIPVSVLPGRATRHGYGAEITITAQPHLSESLLPTTFKSLVLNDLVDQLGLPVTRVADALSRSDAINRKLRAALAKENATKRQNEAELVTLQRRGVAEARLIGGMINHQVAALSMQATAPQAVVPRALVTVGLLANARLGALFESLSKPVQSPPPGDESLLILRRYQDEAAASSPDPLTNAEVGEKDQAIQTILDTLGLSGAERSAAQQALETHLKIGIDRTRIQLLTASVERSQHRTEALEDCVQRQDLSMEVQAVYGPSSRSRQSSIPVPPTQIAEVFGGNEIKTIARNFTDRYTGPNVRWNGPPQFRVHPLDVHRFLQDELDGAYEMLARDAAQPLWDKYVNYARSPGCQNLADEIRGAHFAVVADAREEFFDDLRREERQVEPTNHVTTVDALAWAIIVEAALLNDRLITDMQAVAAAKGCPAMIDGDVAFYHPRPSPEAAASFSRYVLCRWPIHVFALEPVTDDQNIADKYSATRELQLSLSLAFVSGQISANNMLQLARKLETDMESINLNRTAVAFSHGNDTFGWQFYPRFQSPPTPSNLRAFAQTILGPSPNYDVCTRKIEPGMRDCHAVVIMPSFVPYVTFDIRSNWFRLTHHHGWLPTRHHVEQSMADITKLSRSVQAMHRGARYICDSDCYRPGEIARLMRRVHQLDRELPLQTMLAQVPVENTIGGYQMFSHGVTDLAPDLYGWYGGPGIILDCPVRDEVLNCASAQPADCSPKKPSPASGANTPATLVPVPENAVSTCSYRGDGTAAQNASLLGAGGGTPSGDGGGNQGSQPTPKPPQQPAAGNQQNAAAANGGSPCGTQPCADMPLGTCPLPKTASCDQGGTTLFLVGNHFSVHQTMVIAGDQCIPDPILLSRQVMQVTIPRSVRPVLIDGEWFVDVHVATPYGVTSHLHIPVANSCGTLLPLDVDDSECDEVPDSEAENSESNNGEGFESVPLPSADENGANFWDGPSLYRAKAGKSARHRSVAPRKAADEAEAVAPALHLVRARQSPPRGAHGAAVYSNAVRFGGKRNGSESR